VSKFRLVYLPEGADWYDFWTGKCYAGGQMMIAVAPLDTMPLFVRSGSIVPLGPDITYADEHPNASLDLCVYPGQNGSFTLYDDEGDNYNYEQGHFATIHLSWDDSTRRLTLHDRQGSYPGMPDSREFRIVFGGTEYDQNLLESKGVQTIVYKGREISIEL
jgi:alpha-D-xyloside xylohydrolase